MEWGGVGLYSLHILNSLDSVASKGGYPSSSRPLPSSHAASAKGGYHSSSRHLGIEWDRIGWDGMGWDEMGWDGMRLDEMGWDRMGREIT